MGAWEARVGFVFNQSDKEIAQVDREDNVTVKNYSYFIGAEIILFFSFL